MFALFKYFFRKEIILSAILILLLIGHTYCDVSLPEYTAEIVAKMQAGKAAGSIMQTGGIMLAYAGMSTAATVIEIFLAGVISTSLATRLREKMFENILALSAKETDAFTVGSLLTRTTNDVQQVSFVLVLFLRLGLGAPLMATFAIFRIAQSGWELTLVTGAGVTFLLVSQTLIMLIVTPKFKRIQKLTDRLNGQARERLSGIRVVRAFRAEGYEENKFAQTNEKLKRTNIFAGRITALLFPMISLVSNAVTLSIYWLGCWLIVRNNDAGFFPTMFAYTQLAAQVIMAFMLILMLLIMYPRVKVSAKRIREVLNSRSSVEEPAEETSFTERGVVEMRDVSFAYAKENVVEHISFRVERGQTLAIVGSSGSGKTTILSLIERFYDTTSGEVLVGGVNVKKLSWRQLHRTLSFVPQKSVLFSGTIRENIAFKGEGNVERAARIACVEEFIRIHESGLDAVVAQGGKNFSGGQKQRLCIARAVAADAEILLFDDSFSALDYRTDAVVRANLKKDLPDVTKVIVAQRIGTIKDADAILVLQDGKVAGFGKHEELLKNCNMYRTIALSQLSREELGI